jgi:hypothetical protein
VFYQLIFIKMSKQKFEDGSGDKNYFTVVPNYVLNHSTLWDREVYIQMKRVTGDSGTCWMSLATLAKQCEISRNRLRKSLSYLVEHKWITKIGTKTIKTSGGEQEVNEYKVADIWKMNTDFYTAKGGSPDARPFQRGVTDEAKGGSPEVPKEEPYNNNHTSISFSSYWLLYPKKVEKKKCEQRWNKLSVTTKEMILKDLPLRLKGEKWSKDGGRFIENPMTYLNGERWNDEITQAKAKGQSTFSGLARDMKI